MQDEAPAVDFAVWGPHDRRHARYLRSMALVWVEGGGLQPKTLTGPSGFESWDRSWAVFATAMLAWGAASPGALTRSRDGLRDLVVLYPQLWGVIARADQAMRFEQWPLMADEAPPQGDWSVILAASAWGEDGKRQWWWDRHVIRPAATHRPQETINELEGYVPRGASLASSSTSSWPTSSPAAPGEPPFKKSRHVRRQEKALAAAAASAAPPPPPPTAPPTTSGQPPRGGVCFAYNLGKCTAAVCPRGYPHVCSACGEKHVACQTEPCKHLVDKGGRKKRK